MGSGAVLGCVGDFFVTFPPMTDYHFLLYALDGHSQIYFWLLLALIIKID